MSIKKPVRPADVEAFISNAPDATQEKKGVIRGKKQIITVGFAPELLDKIDAKALELSISRAAFISLACSRAVAE